VVEVPQVVVKEVTKVVKRPEIQERVVEKPKIEIVEKLVEVPQVKIVEKIIDVPEVHVQEKVVEIPKIIYEDRVIEVPKIVYEERIEYEDRLEYREVLVEKTEERWTTETQTLNVGPWPAFASSPVSEPAAAGNARIIDSYTTEGKFVGERVVSEHFRVGVKRYRTIEKVVEVPQATAETPSQFNMIPQSHATYTNTGRSSGEFVTSSVNPMLRASQTQTVAA